ncbi:unnamed protein product [Staurois parvus]|uniref:Uncharacterized protein n=1 Tax=Staurois parvus TaxID=386267 RepID=A0ABN9GAY9_9NEOB|nr:unnamed protein product [Staurois parvus]
MGDHGAPVPLPKLKKAYEKGTRSISWGPLLTAGPRACPSFQMVSPPLCCTDNLSLIQRFWCSCVCLDAFLEQ